LDEIVELRVQQPPKKQVATKMEKERKSATVVICYAVSPEERIEPEYYYLAQIWGKYLRKVTLLLKYGPPHPVKATLENQVETQEVPPSSAGFQIWKILLCDNHQPVHPWSTTTSGNSRGAKKAPLWWPQGHGCRKCFKQAFHLAERTAANVQQQQLWMTMNTVPTLGKQNIKQ
jgi:hypothetical protein